MLSSLYRQSNSGGPPLRIGLLLDSAVLPSCFAEVVDHIQQSNFARLELLIYNAEEAPKADVAPRRRSLFDKVFDIVRTPQRRKTFLYELYQRWDARNIVPSEDPLAPVDCSARLAQVEAMTVVPIRKRFVHRFQPEDIQRIRQKELDVLIRFGFNILRGDILNCAKYGVWSYHHGDGDYYRGGPPHFWEVYEGNPISGVMLQVLTEELDAGKVLYKGMFSTAPGISVAQNRVQPYWGASTFMIQKLHELHQYGWQQVADGAVTKNPYLGKKKIYTSPTNAEMLQWLVPVLTKKAVRRIGRRPVLKHWRMAVRSGGRMIADCASGSVPDVSGFRLIESPKGHFYADPFLIEEGGRLWIFFEDFDYAKNLGKISCAELRDGALVGTVTALETPYHLSYPHVFRSNNELYMIPETGSNNTVELYRCVGFPNQWKLEKVLFHGRAVDVTFWEENGLYWFFVTLQEVRGAGTQLWLFYSTSLTGEWTPHPANPLSTDVRDSRGAGAIFRRNGKLFRPSQDCGKHYGYSFSLNEILVMDRERYQEKRSVTVDPTWAPNLIATHTYNFAGQVEIIDGCAPMLASDVGPG